MKGRVDEIGRAMVDLPIASEKEAERKTIEVWVDTGFTGDLVLPIDTISRLGLRRSAVIRAMLADGTTTALDSYRCVTDWFGQERSTEVIAKGGELPLLGIGMLDEKELIVNYRSREVSIQ